MEENKNYNEWIDAYLDEELAGEELEQFEKKLTSDMEFRREVNAQKMVRDSIKRSEVKNFLNEINNEYEAEVADADLLDSNVMARETIMYRKNLDNQYNETQDHKKEKRFISRFTILSIAASVIIIIGIGLFVLNQKVVDTTPQAYIAQSFTLEVTAVGGLRAVAEEIFVQVIENTTYDFYYSFTDGVLKLYFKEVEISSGEIDIFYDMFSAQPYEIEISGVRYVMVETEDETPLPLVKK